MRSTDSRTFASCTASEQDVVVFPTPPLPPTKIHLSESARRTRGRSGKRRVRDGRGGERNAGEVRELFEMVA